MAMMGGKDGEGDPTKISVEHPPRYGTFPPPPPPSSSAPLLPQPQYPPPLTYYHNPQQPATYHAIQVGYQTQPYQALVDGIPMREPPLPFCGIGIGWALFLSGFFLAAIPWYVGVFILLFVALDYREKPGLVACTVAAVLTLFPIILQAFNFHIFW
ncbi:60S ribosomal protein L18a-like protein [Phoenix dactylifera]|uniref:60S ribosomal protein L18a-like protein n=1 Tax=Phoenix dactylifera TaxID=42345 RepID=A0A8B7BSN3_PHODC|nr:60S ribosomal protein L18a-like protein [Phoenix dactylifera]